MYSISAITPPSSVCVSPCREPISSVGVPSSTNEAYELVKQAEEEGKGTGREKEMRDVSVYEEVSAHAPAQPVAASEGVYESIP